MKKKKLLITGPFDSNAERKLSDNGFTIIHLDANAGKDDLESAILDADAYILGGNEMLTADLINKAENLCIIVFIGQQPETFMEADMKKVLEIKGIILESTPGASTNAVAEMACALILSAMRRIPYLTSQVRMFKWPSITGQELSGKVIGIYGMGRIGYTVAKRLKSFDVSRIIYSDVVRSERGEADLGAVRVPIEQLFGESDIVSLHSPLTSETKGIINEDLLHRMKSTAVLANTARAGIVDPNALYKALRENWISCAAFDGYYIEGPQFMDLSSHGDPYRLLEFTDKFFVTSHQGFNTDAALRTESDMASEKLISFFAKEERQSAA